MEYLNVWLVFICFNFFNFTFGKQVTKLESEAIDLSFYGGRIYGAPNHVSGKTLENWIRNQSGVNPEELGNYLEGDILVPRPLGRNGVIGETYRWKSGIIPFEIRGNFRSQDLDLIRKAMMSYHQSTCIKFVPRKTSDPDFISIQSGQSGCWSSVGRSGGGQVVNLQVPGCVTLIGTVIHELMHASGFLHEQNREERDDYVYIQTQNIQKGTESNFDKVPKGVTNAYGVGYDYGSVMHYSANAFSINGNPTIIPKRQTSVKMGQREGFSIYDIQKINKMYNCAGTSAGYQPDFSAAIGTIFESIINGFISNGDAEEVQQ